MSENILKILLKELTTIRITCRAENCGAVIELPMGIVEEKSTRDIYCPFCQAKIRSNQGTDALSKLATAIRELEKAKGVEVAFVIKQSDKDGGK